MDADQALSLIARHRPAVHRWCVHASHWSQARRQLVDEGVPFVALTQASPSTRQRAGMVRQVTVFSLSPPSALEVASVPLGHRHARSQVEHILGSTRTVSCEVGPGWAEALDAVGV